MSRGKTLQLKDLEKKKNVADVLWKILDFQKQSLLLFIFFQKKIFLIFYFSNMKNSSSNFLYIFSRNLSSMKIMTLAFFFFDPHFHLLEIRIMLDR